VGHCNGKPRCAENPNETSRRSNDSHLAALGDDAATEDEHRSHHFRTGEVHLCGVDQHRVAFHPSESGERGVEDIRRHEVELAVQLEQRGRRIHERDDDRRPVGIFG
jgi:hypothetical protein